MGVSIVPRTSTPTAMVEVGRPAVTMSTMLEQEEKERRGAHFRSKSSAWTTPSVPLKSVNSLKVGRAGSRSFRFGKDRQDITSQRPSKWTRFLRKLRFDGGNKRVQVARPEWLNYDPQNYAMNFEDDVETSQGTSKQMPKIFGPGAREIVTVLLTRSPTTNRNSGAILIPKPVMADVKQVTGVPLWQRRNVSAPASLLIKLRQTSMEKRRSTSL
jgi:hypothetical protein